MTDKVLVVTSPDDTVVDAVRLLLVDLSPEHTQIISDALGTFTAAPNIVVYMWKMGDPIDWLFDKKQKSQAIIFNADCYNELIIGYLAAQPRSYYFGTLKTLQKVNNNAIYNTDECISIIDNLLIRYE